jgi:hypothetical protein
MHIREIRLSQLFQDLCRHLLVKEYKDFQVPDDSGGDAGFNETTLLKRETVSLQHETIEHQP